MMGRKLQLSSFSPLCWQGVDSFPLLNWPDMADCEKQHVACIQTIKSRRHKRMRFLVEVYFIDVHR